MKEMDNLDRIRKTMNDAIKNIPGKYLGTYLKVLEPTKGLKQVKAKCYECIGFETVKDSITDCRGWSCPLYWTRPYQYPDTKEVRDTLFTEYCQVPPSDG